MACGGYPCVRVKEFVDEITPLKRRQNLDFVPHSPLKKAVLARDKAIQEKWPTLKALSWKSLKMHQRLHRNEEFLRGNGEQVLSFSSSHPYDFLRASIENASKVAWIASCLARTTGGNGGLKGIQKVLYTLLFSLTNYLTLTPVEGFK
jgi:hypothetical protein